MSNDESHPTVFVQVGWLEGDIDVEIAPLIEEIWKADIATINSCQENQLGIVWIEFMTFIDAVEFLNIAAGPYSREIDSLYNRIRLAWDTETGPVEGSWQYDIHPDDMSVDVRITDDDYYEETPTGPPEFLFNVSIRFPRSDMPILVERLQAFNEAKSSGETVSVPVP